MTASSPANLSQKLAQLIAASTLRGYPHQSQEAESDLKTMPCITFRTYMAYCLYDEQFGYYRSGRTRIGKDGDFYTSSAVGDIMATAIEANLACYEKSLGSSVSLLEWGAGTGKLAAAIAAICKNRTKQPSVVCVEDHPAHAEAILRTFEEAELDVSALRISSSEQMEQGGDEWPQPCFLVANELLDAFPVHRICSYEGRLWELGVACIGNNRFAYTRIPLDEQDQRMRQALEESGLALAEGQIAELCPDGGDWVKRIGKRMKQGRVLLIDYGHEAVEYGAEHRMNGTLLTYARHQASDSPFLQPGERDITAHVNFSYIRKVAASAGFREVYYDTQKQFLLDHGVLELLTEHDGRDPFSEAARRNRFVRQLLLSDGMSETFKVMIVEKV